MRQVPTLLLLLLMLLPGLVLPAGAAFDLCRCAQPPEATGVACCEPATAPTCRCGTGSAIEQGEAISDGCCEHCTCRTVEVPDDPFDPWLAPRDADPELAPPDAAPISRTSITTAPRLVVNQARVRPPPDRERSLPLLL